MRPSSVKRKTKPTFEDVRRWFDENLDAEKLDLDDQEVYENVYHGGRWAGVFQFSEKGAQRFAQKAKPRSIDDIAAITSIYRPGPLMANVDKAFVSDKEKVEAGEKVQYVHPVVERVLSTSYGHMVYQEDFMKLGRELGGLSWDDCDKLRKILVKKSIGTDVNEKKAAEAREIRQRFTEGAVANGMSLEQVDDLWERMSYFSGYGFNRSVTTFTDIDTYTSNGVWSGKKHIFEVSTGEYVRSRDERTGEDIFTEVVGVHDHGELEVLEYSFEDGSVVQCTADHKFRTSDGRMLTIRQIVEEKLDVVSVRPGPDTGKTV